MKSLLKKMSAVLNFGAAKDQEKTGLLIQNRQVNWLLAGALLTGSFCFLLGYFWGYRCALERFVAKIEEESFADRINYALYTMNDRDISEFESEQEESNGSGSLDDSSATGDDQEEVEETLELTVAAEEEPAKTAEVVNAKQVEKKLLEKKAADYTSVKQVEKKPLEGKVADCVPVQAKKEVVFIAPLAGFGTLQAAMSCLQRVKLLDPQATLEHKVSVTAKGRKVTWYQVMTGEFETKEALQKVVNTLQQKEHIKGVRILEKRKG